MMRIVLTALATLFFGVVGLNLFSWGLRAIRNRRFALEQFTGTPAAGPLGKFALLWTALTLGGGVSMLAASAAVWFSPRTGLLLGFGPIVAFLALLVPRGLWGKVV